MKYMTKVLLTCIDTIPSFSLSVFLPLEEMEKQGLVTLRLKKLSDATQEDMLWCDVYIAVRASRPEDETFINVCRHQGKYTVYYMDEDLGDMPYAPAKSTFFRRQVVHEQVLANISACHCLLVSDPALFGKYKYLTEKIVLSVACIPEITTHQTRAPYKVNKNIQTEFDNCVELPQWKKALHLLYMKPFAGTLFLLHKVVRKIDGRWKALFP